MTFPRQARFLAPGWLAGSFLLFSSLAPQLSVAAPKVVVISLDGATPRIFNGYLENGWLPQNQGVGLLRLKGTSALQNFSVTPTLTAAAHISIGSGSTPAATDINTNFFNLVASPITNGISGFGAPIGGYSFSPLGESPNPTARPIWHSLLAAGKTVVTATFPGGDGVDVIVPGVANSPIIQPSDLRKVNYTVPFGAFGGLSAQGYSLAAADFSPAPDTTVNQLVAAGHPSYSPVLQKTTPLNTVTVGGVSYILQVAALDTTDDATANYDTLVIFDQNSGIQPGPFSLPSTGPAYIKASEKKSSRFYFEGSSTKAGNAWYVSLLNPDLSQVHIAQYSANNLPRTAPVLDVVDDINAHVGFWANQGDFRIPERISSGFTDFTDLELEAIYEDQVAGFVDYQTRIALRAIEVYPNADLLMVYIEEPDGSEHQYLLTDARQATNPKDPTSIGRNQDQSKVSRYRSYVFNAYSKANQAVDRIIRAVGTDGNGVPLSNIFVVSDHGFEQFYTSVSIRNLLNANGFPLTKVAVISRNEFDTQLDEKVDFGTLGAPQGSVAAVTSGPVVNLYINLQGRQPGGTVSQADYLSIQQELVDLLKAQLDTNPIYLAGGPAVPIFPIVRARPAKLGDPNFGLETDNFIGQDAGDVVAILAPGYNFDGIQSPVVQRSGDPVSDAPVLSVPNFYGAHGYNGFLPNLSAIFYAAGPNIRKGLLRSVRNIDVAPTVAEILGVTPDATVQGHVIEGLLK